MWATRTGPDHYRLENSPFFAYGVSWQDIVEARPAPDGTLSFVRVVEKSGRRTIRVFFDGPHAAQERIDAVLAAVNVRGATYEGMNRIYFAVDVSPDIALGPVVRFLTQEGVQWEHVDPELGTVALRDQLAPG